jgi:group II intron reverse transcriptase/maturase
MQSATTVLGVIRERGRHGLPLERLYRQLFNPQLFLVAYGRIYANQGAMTPGTAGETADGMSLAKIETIIGALRAESYRWTPVKRVYIPKKNGKKRPLGLPTWSDKLVAEVVRLLLEAYYDVQFSDRSHGFRPRRGCHTALREITDRWQGTHWFIEGDISDCFGSLDHDVMLAVLAERVHDGRFLSLIGRMLKAGYLEDWRWNATLSGAPQGGVASPILSNVYLDRLDRFVEQHLLPDYNRGRRRRWNPPYSRIDGQMKRARQRGDREALKKLRKQKRLLPCFDPADPNYRRLRYVRYADDWLLGFAGPKREAEEIKDRIGEFLREQLKLELSASKTLITHAASQSARFLGYDIRVQYSNTKITSGLRGVNGTIGLYLPHEVIRERCARYMKGGKPARRPMLIHDSDFTIVARYQAEYRGLVQYYLLAQNVVHLNLLNWVMGLSLLRTLACKHDSTAAKMARKYRATFDTPSGRRTGFEVRIERAEGRKPLMARWGGISLQRQRDAEIVDRAPDPTHQFRNELVRRLVAGQCELCGSRTDIEVHHIRKLADLRRPGRPDPGPWIRQMASRRRKTLVVCADCHHNIHAGRGTASTRK